MEQTELGRSMESERDVTGRLQHRNDAGSVQACQMGMLMDQRIGRCQTGDASVPLREQDLDAVVQDLPEDVGNSERREEARNPRVVREEEPGL